MTDLSAKEEFEAAQSELTSEFVAMFRHATSSGMGPMSDLVVQTMDEIGRDEGGPSIVGLVEGHLELARLVSPATPRGLDLMVPHRGGRRRMPPIARQMMICAVFSMIATLGLGLSPMIGEGGHDMTLFHGHGSELAINLAFLISAAGLGASFHALYTLSRYLISATYDPLYDPSYWIRLFLGILSGVLLATMELGVKGSERFLLAIAGGFSTMLVYRILQHLVSTFEQLLVPTADKEARAPAMATPKPPIEASPEALPEAEPRFELEPPADERGAEAIDAIDASAET